ncbi:MAG: MscS Mechanosensitive ion channel [Geminicoccaceae bacterium]|nr:MscS Mechanosensitive ion channel [Geminicoccaceae bacterium]
MNAHKAEYPLNQRRAIRLLLVAAIGAWTAPAVAQDTSSADRSASAESAAELPTAPVVVDGVTLFRVRGISAYPAEQRAAAIADRIAALASDRTIPAESLVVRDGPMASDLVAAGRRIFSVVDADARLEGVSRQVLAEVYRGRTAEAIEAFRRNREGAVLWRNAARALVATLALALGLWLGARALRLLRTGLERRYRTRLRDVQFHSVEIVRAERLWQGLHGALGTVAALLALLAGYLYLDYVLLLFPWTRALGNSLAAILLGPLATLGSGALRFFPDFVFLVILAVVTRWVLRVIRLFFQRVGDGTIPLSGFEAEWAKPTERIVRVLVIAFAVVIAYPHIPGSGSEAFKGVTLMLGLLFSIGSPSVISNMVAGQSLAYRRAFKVGDRVKVGEHIGEVAQMRLLTTYLRSPKNELVVIPNALILNGEVVNYSTLAKDMGLILHTIVRIGYETPWRQVEAMLLEAAGRTPGLLPEPRPFVLQKELGTFAIDYEINAYCVDPRVMLQLYTALHRNILDVFNEYAVQIMTPGYEGDPERPKVVPREQWFAAPANSAPSSNGPNPPIEEAQRVASVNQETLGTARHPSGQIQGHDTH